MARATEELVVMSDEELAGHVTESRRELLNLRFQLATGQLDNPARIGRVRREIARSLTLLRQRDLAVIDGSEGVDHASTSRTTTVEEEA
jgi:large subunit ribosomal protein L29